MMPLLFLAAASADLDALDQAVARCDRHIANPVFSGEAARRSSFLLDAYKEQEGIVADRLALADQQRALREATEMKPAEIKQTQKQLDLLQAAIDDRQKALNDKRLLEGIRDDAMDSMRRYFLMNCPAGGKETVK
jgi:DNA-binding response OmpR family regulator